jgi:hypothetical protein
MAWLMFVMTLVITVVLMVSRRKWVHTSAEEQR